MELVKNYENHKAADEQVIQQALDDLKEKLKPPSPPARAVDEEQEQYKDALDRL